MGYRVPIRIISSARAGIAAKKVKEKQKKQKIDKQGTNEFLFMTPPLRLSSKPSACSIESGKGGLSAF
jgi:hypothetical protein